MKVGNQLKFDNRVSTLCKREGSQPSFRISNFEFQNGERTQDFERRKIDTANKEDFLGRIQKTRSTYYKYNKF